MARITLTTPHAPRGLFPELKILDYEVDRDAKTIRLRYAYAEFIGGELVAAAEDVERPKLHIFSGADFDTIDTSAPADARASVTESIESTMLNLLITLGIEDGTVS